jgi:hypothetical protein
MQRMTRRPMRFTRDPRDHAASLGASEQGEPACSSQIVFIRFFEPFKHLR